MPSINCTHIRPEFRPNVVYRKRSNNLILLDSRLIGYILLIYLIVWLPLV